MNFNTLEIGGDREYGITVFNLKKARGIIMGS